MYKMVNKGHANGNVKIGLIISSVVDEERFELSVQLPIRILSRDVVSAAHPLVHLKNEIIFINS